MMMGMETSPLQGFNALKNYLVAHAVRAAKQTLPFQGRAHDPQLKTYWRISLGSSVSENRFCTP
jgi:hypothetical protein